MTHTNRPILLNWPATGEHPACFASSSSLLITTQGVESSKRVFELHPRWHKFVPEIRKPFDNLPKGLLSEKSRATGFEPTN